MNAQNNDNSAQFQWLVQLQIRIDRFILNPGTPNSGIIAIAQAASDALTPLVTDALVADIDSAVGRLNALAPTINSATERLEDAIAAIQATNDTLNQIANQIPTLVSLLTSIRNADSDSALRSALANFVDDVINNAAN